VFDTVATPTFSQAAGPYTGEQSVTLSSATSGATIYYTTDGTVPTTSSPLNSTTPVVLTIDTTTTIKAIAVAPGMANSTISSGSYDITPDTPTLNPLDGTGSPATASISSTPGAAIYFTTDGITTPTAIPEDLYSAPIPLPTGTTTVIQAIAVSSGNTSALGTATYVIP
jgi:hypothetical protein